MKTDRRKLERRLEELERQTGHQTSPCQFREDNPTDEEVAETMDILGRAGILQDVLALEEDSRIVEHQGELRRVLQEMIRQGVLPANFGEG